ncbi:nuclear transport factor 2 family protein [Streptomyces sp. NPDC047072]|uniref:nuclear transport factor 2 family protein n=1 Tax=Streptomyces sp. NPDC047072 TaxID=3154809 RepID=UPI0033EAF7A5
MSTPPAPTDHDEVIRAFRAYLQAMTDGDTGTLDDLLDSGFTLTHITGYVQPKVEWFAQMRAGQFVYHAIRENDVTVETEGDAARLVGRVVADATVYGTHADWRLRLTIDYAWQGDAWTAHRAVATTW